MKKLAALLTVLALLLGAPALAFEGTGYPAWDGASDPDNGLCAAFDGERIALSFDPSADYSNVQDGTIQACFFAYDATEEHYLELYLLLPQDVAGGDVLQSGDGTICSISLYETALNGETLYYADEIGGDGTSYELVVESVENTGAAIAMNGRLTAQLCRYVGDQPASDMLRVEEARFRFTLPLSAGNFVPAPSQAPDAAPAQPENSPAPVVPTLPESSAAPAVPAPPENSAPARGAPAFTLPPDYAVI